MKTYCQCGHVKIVANAWEIKIKCEGCDWYYTYKAMPPQFITYLEEIFNWIKDKEKENE